jgi:5-methylcytosine-specific restriction enzyme A
VFDPLITDSARRGYYPVYLFHGAEPIVHLSLNQGTTETREQFAGETRNVLRDRASIMRKRLADYADLLPVTAIDLGSNARLPGDYVAAHILGLTYEPTRLPEEANLRADLQTVISAYRALTFRGGLNPVMKARKVMMPTQLARYWRSDSIGSIEG